MDGASHAAVKNAINEWRDSSREASLAVLHWLGHGEELGEGGTSPIYALACEDATIGGKAVRAIDWIDTYQWLRYTLGRPKLVCFIDTCRPRRRFPPGKIPTVYKEHVDVGPEANGMVFNASKRGHETLCAKPGLSVCGDFDDGGALFSEAALLAMDRFAADHRDDEIGHAVYPNLIQEAVMARLERWSRRIADIKHFDLRPHLDMDCNESHPVFLSQSPASMVELILQGAEFSDADCRITRSGHSPITPFKGEDRWEADLPRDDCTAEVTISGLATTPPHGAKLLQPTRFHEKRVIVVPAAGGSGP